MLCSHVLFILHIFSLLISKSKCDLNEIKFYLLCSDLEVTQSASECEEDQVNSCPDDVEDMGIVQSYIVDNETAKQCIETCLGNNVGYRSACDENVEGLTPVRLPM